MEIGPGKLWKSAVKIRLPSCMRDLHLKKPRPEQNGLESQIQRLDGDPEWLSLNVLMKYFELSAVCINFCSRRLM